MASVLPSDANTFRIVSSWGLASPRSILAIWGCLTPLRASSWRWLMPLFLPCFNQLRDERNAHIAFRNLFRREMLLVKFFIPYRETALRIIHAFPSLSLKSANSRLACSISRFGGLLGLFYKAMQKNENAVNPSRKQDTVVNRSKFPNLSVKVFGIFFGEIGAIFG